MSPKPILLMCAQALLVKSALGQFVASGLAAPYNLYDGLAAPFAYDGQAGWIGRGLANNGLAAPFAYKGLAGWAGRGLAYDGYPALATAMDFTPTSCGAFPVTSASIVPPTGISVISENVYGGTLAVAGKMPFVGTVGMEGVLPTVGTGAINHACGNGINAMLSENTAFAPAIAPFGAAIAPGFAGAAVAPDFTGAAFGGWAGRGWGYAL